MDRAAVPFFHVADMLHVATPALLAMPLAMIPPLTKLLRSSPWRALRSRGID
jgi:hypothetical protein